MSIGQYWWVYDYLGCLLTVAVSTTICTSLKLIGSYFKCSSTVFSWIAMQCIVSSHSQSANRRAGANLRWGNGDTQPFSQLSISESEIRATYCLPCHKSPYTLLSLQLTADCCWTVLSTLYILQNHATSYPATYTWIPSPGGINLSWPSCTAFVYSSWDYLAQMPSAQDVKM